MSYHPLELAKADLTADEALWTVLWTQGLSEEGGARMKVYDYGTSILSTLYTVATLASGLQAARPWRPKRRWPPRARPRPRWPRK